MLKSRKDNWYVFYLRLRSGELLVFSYLGAIALGTVLLWLPWSSVNGGLHFVDALFTATSAVCVTGLTVVDTGTTFTVFGKSVLLLLIQIGGLGIMTFSVLMFLTAGRLPALRDRWVIESMFIRNQKILIWDLVKLIFLFTFICEAVGVLLLGAGWIKSGYPPVKAFCYGLFHSVSAFCNAGFAFFQNSLEDFRGDWLINFTVCGLIILGGIGFSVIYELSQRIRSPLSRRISLNTRLVLFTTLFLLGFGTLCICFFESSNALRGLPFGQKVLASFFQSTTARTAGFNTVRISFLSNASLLILILLMFIGASPGSCGGGIRTTSLALLFLLFVNRFRGSSKLNIAGRTVPDETIRKVVSLTMLGFLVIMVNTMLLLATQTEEFMHPLYRELFVSYLFESVSALGTVGLSLGITSSLNAVGKVLIVFMMLIGRVGLVTMAYGLVREQVKSRFEYAAEDVMI
ncbi:MAG TPA: potassium transporter TrkG [archaeon]|nr:potassium transporter TrkG [archaeon]